MPEIKFIGVEEVKLLPIGYTTTPIIAEAQIVLINNLNNT